MNMHVWANSFGLWQARVALPAAATAEDVSKAQRAARKAIAAELAARTAWGHTPKFKLERGPLLRAADGQMTITFSEADV